MLPAILAPCRLLLTSHRLSPLWPFPLCPLPLRPSPVVPLLSCRHLSLVSQAQLASPGQCTIPGIRSWPVLATAGRGSTGPGQLQSCTDQVPLQHAQIWDVPAPPPCCERLPSTVAPLLPDSPSLRPCFSDCPIQARPPDPLVNKESRTDVMLEVEFARAASPHGLRSPPLAPSY